MGRGGIDGVCRFGGLRFGSICGRGSLRGPARESDNGCRRDGCGPAPLPVSYDAAVRGVIVQPYENGAFDGVLALGPTTAAEPAQP